MSDYSVRLTENVDIVKELHAKTFPLDHFDQIKNSTYWLVWNNDRPVGFCSVRKLDQKILFLSRAGLLGCARGKGLHKRMIQVRVRWAIRQGYDKLITYTTIENIQSSSNLEKCGFRRYIPDYAYAGKNVLYYMRDLT